MSSITYPFTFVAATTAIASQVNANFSAVSTVVNGGIDNSNIIAGANIAISKLGLNPGGVAFNKTTTGNRTWASGLTTDTQPQQTMTADAGLQFGPGGVIAPDVALLRSALNTLQLTNAAGGAATFNLNAGTISNVATLATVASATITTANVTTENVSGVMTISGSYAGTSPFGLGNHRVPPTTGALSGEYWTTGNWSTTGPCTFTNVRMHVGGTVSVNNAITISTELGSGSGFGSISIGRPGTGAGQTASGSGASYGGVGGFSSSGGGGGTAYMATTAYSIDNYLGGSGGGPGDSIQNFGGAGGGSFYLEAVGAITIGANIAANGGTGVGTGGSIGGGGGSGGAIDIRSLASITVSGGVTISANGGNGGNNATAGGGGGGGGWVRLRAPTVTNSGTVTVNGGTLGTGGAGGSNGAVGQTDVASTGIGPRMIG